MIALLEARGAGLFTRHNLWRDIIAGTVVGVVAMPLAMAFAIASGVSPQMGLYTAIVAGTATAILGGTRVQISGPTGAFVVVLAGVTAHYGVAGLQLATLMAGLILLVMGISRLGSVVRYIPDPVIVGFTSGIGVIIWVGQWKDFFGLHPAPYGSHFHEKLWALLKALPTLDVPTTAIAIGSLVVTVWGASLLPRIPGLRRLPSPLLAMVLATLVQAIARFPSVATIGTAFGGIPRSLPALGVPEITVAQGLQLVGPAFTIAMLGAIESLLTAVVADGMTGHRHDSNQELVGQGIANILAPLFGGFAATGAVARTATSIRNGAVSPIAGIVHGLFLVIVIVLLAPWAAAIPLSALAAILFAVAWNMSDIPHCRSMLKTAATADRLLLALTFLLTVFVDLVVGVSVGVVFAALLFMQRMSETVSLQQQSFDGNGKGESADASVTLPASALVYRIEGPMFFGAAEKLERVLERAPLGVATVVLRFGAVPFVDATGLQTLIEIVRRFHKYGVRVLLCGIHDGLADTLRSGGVFEAVGEENICRNMQDVSRRLA